MLHIPNFKKGGFTLIELLVVIAIIGLLSSIVLISVKETRERARIAKGLNFSAQIYHALGAYIIGEWNFNEGSEGQVATGAEDSSGDNNGSCFGASCPVWQCEKDDTPSGQGCSLEFDGVNDYIEVAHDESLNITDEITIEAWAKSKAFNSKNYAVLAKIETYFLYTRAGWIDRPHFYLYFDGGSPKYVYGDQIPVDTWQHIVGTYKESDRTMRIFQDGVEIRTTLLAGLTDYHIDVTANAVTIGRNWDFFNGLIDDVHIYEQALSSAQIKKLYAEGAKKHGLYVQF